LEIEFQRGLPSKVDNDIGFDNGFEEIEEE
jgi:hypothetical protein